MNKRGAKTLRDYIDIKHGFAFSSDYYADSGDFVLLTPGNFQEQGGFRWSGDKQKYFAGEIPAEYVLSTGQMLIAMTEQAPGLLGSTFFVPGDRVYLHNQRLGLISIKDPQTLDAEYLHYFFSSTPIREKISKESAGTKVKHTSPDKLLQISLKPLRYEEQREIAAILRTWDVAIELYDALAEQLQKQHFALIHQLVFGSFRLSPYASNRDTKKHRWFNLPSDWQCKRIDSLAQEVSERNREDRVAH